MRWLREAVLRPAAFVFGCLVLLLVGPPLFVFLALRGAALRAWFYRAHRRHGRFILFVYSESPKWKAYLEEHILPRLRGSAVVLNWSEREQWPRVLPWESRVFHHFTGAREFNPVALVFSGPWRVTPIRFYRAFLELAHGRESALRQAEAELSRHLTGGGP